MLIIQLFLVLLQPIFIVMLFNFKGYKNSYSGIWGFVLRTLITSVAVILAAWALPGVHISSVWTAIVAAIVIGLLDNIVRPGLVVATLPFTMASMGCFLFVINAVLILLTSVIVPGFKVDGFWTAMLYSLLLTVINYLLEIPSKHLLVKTFKERHSRNDGATSSEDGSPNGGHFDEYEDVTDAENAGGEEEKNASGEEYAAGGEEEKK